MKRLLVRKIKNFDEIPSKLRRINPLENVIKFRAKKGEPGDDGIEGARGTDGGQGIKGDKGDQGKPGIKGDPGPEGNQGKPGQKGGVGDPGPQGKDGWQGVQGIKGDKGLTGKPGPHGLKGNPGKEGKEGKKGEPGKPPAHEWDGTKLRFKQPNGRWGKWLDLRGFQGISGQPVFLRSQEPSQFYWTDRFTITEDGQTDFELTYPPIAPETNGIFIINNKPYDFGEAFEIVNEKTLRYKPDQTGFSLEVLNSEGNPDKISYNYIKG